MLRIGLSVLLLLGSLGFSSIAHAAPPVSCSLQSKTLRSLNPFEFFAFPNTYTDCIEPIKLVWRQTTNSMSGYSFTTHRNFGPSYDTLQDAIDNVTPKIIASLGKQLDYKNNGCLGCGLITQEVFDQYFSNGGLCLGIWTIDPESTVPPSVRNNNYCSPSQFTHYNNNPVSVYAPFQILSETNYPDISDPTLYHLVSLGVYNPIGTAQYYVSGEPVYGYRAYGGPSSLSGSGVDRGFSIVTEPVCPVGYEAAMGKDANNKSMWACVQFAKESLHVGSTGLDSTIEGCAFSCNPVNLATGAKTDYAEDFRNYSPYPIIWDRYYSSFTGQWHFGYERSVSVWTNSTTQLKHASLKRPDGSLVKFKQTSSGWEADTPSNKGIITNFSLVMNGGTLTGYQYKNLKDETENYDLDGRLVSITSLEGWQLAFSYDAKGLLSKVEDDFGRHLLIQRDTSQHNQSAWIESITDGETTVLYEQSVAIGQGVNDHRVLLNAVSHADGTTTEYRYDENATTSNQGSGFLTGIIDQSEQRSASYTYNAAGQVLTSVHDPEGTPTEQVSYNYLNSYTPPASSNIPAGPATQISWAGGSAIASRATSTQGIPKISGFDNPCLYCSGADQSAIVYDAKGNPTSITNYKGVVSHLTYDVDRSLPTQIKEAVGLPEETQVDLIWHSHFRAPVTTVQHLKINGNAHTRTTQMTYNAQGQITERKEMVSTGEAPRIWTYHYTDIGLLQSITSPLQRQVSMTYDAQGNLLTQSNAKGHITTYGQYTTSGLAQLIVDPNGLETKLTYDDAQRLVKIEKGSASTHWETMVYTYNALGLVTRIQFPNEDYIDLAYDNNRQVVKVSNLMSERNLLRNSLNQITQDTVKDSVSNTVTHLQNFNYNTLGQLDRKHTPNGQLDVAYTYDAEGQVTQIKDQYLNHEINQQYNAVNQLVQTTNQLGQVFTRQHNEDKQTIAAKDSRLNTTQYDYNAFGEQIKIHSPDSGITSLQVNGEGEVILETNARLVKKHITRDVLGRITEILYDDETADEESEGAYWGNITETFTYDNCTNGIGQLCTMVDQGGTTIYSYDLWGRVIGKNWTPADQNFSLNVQYTYDAMGQQTGTVYPSGNLLTQTHDNGEVVSLKWGSRILLKDATYQPFHGSIRSWLWGDGLGGVQYTYNVDGQLKKINTGTLNQKDYEYSGLNQVESIQNPADFAPEGTYTYDAANQLLSAQLRHVNTLEFEYDANGNQTRKRHLGTANVLEAQTDYTFDVHSNRLIAIDSAWPLTGITIPITYDFNGNIFNGNRAFYTYNAANRMAYTRSYGTGLRAYFYYNGLGQRVLKERPVGAIGKDYFVYDEEGRVLGVYDENGQAREELVWFDGWRPVATIRETNGVSSIYRIKTDQLGAPSMISNEMGTEVWSWVSREPYGFMAPNEDVDGDNTYFTFSVRFPGQWHDVESGLFYNGFRDYNPDLGRYMQPDPIGLAGGWNTYAYVGNNPVNFVDPSGLKFSNKMQSSSTFQTMALMMAVKSPTAANILERAKNDPRTLDWRIVEENEASEFKGKWTDPKWYKGEFGQPQPISLVMNFNPKMGFAIPCNPEILASAQQSIPPALIFMHELVHFLRSEDPRTFKSMNEQTDSMGKYNNANEKEAILIENQIAREMGWGVRDSHYKKALSGKVFFRTYKTNNLFGSEFDDGL